MTGYIQNLSKLIFICNKNNIFHQIIHLMAVQSDISTLKVVDISSSHTKHVYFIHRKFVKR